MPGATECCIQVIRFVLPCPLSPGMNGLATRPVDSLDPISPHDPLIPQFIISGRLGRKRNVCHYFIRDIGMIPLGLFAKPITPGDQR